MARTGTQFAKLTGDYTSINVYATWQLRKQDKTTKSSTIRLREYLTYSSNGTYGSSYSTFKLQDKTVKSGEYSYSGSGDYLLGYTDIVVEHNEDGTFPDTTLKAYAYSYHFTNKPTKTAKLTSDDIPDIEVNSTIDDVVTYSSDSELGVPLSVQLTSNIVDSTSKLYLVVNEVEHLIFEETTSYKKYSVIFFDENAYTTAGDLKTSDGEIIEKYLSPVGWQDICALIPNDKSITLKFRLKTYIDNIEKGVSEADYNFEITSANIEYTYSFENDDFSYGLVGKRDTMILNVSKPTFSINNAVSKNGATIAQYKFIKLNDAEEWYTITSSSKTFTKPTLLKDTYLCQIFDSRGFFVDTPYLSLGDDFYDVLIPYIDYTKPIFDKVQIARPDEVANYVNLSITGAFWKDSFGNVTNALIAQYRYKLSNSDSYTDWINISPEIDSDGTFSCNSTVENISSNLSATFEIRLIDSTGIEEKLIGIAVSKGKSMFDWGEEYFSWNGELCINDEEVPCFQETSANEDESRNIQLYDSNMKQLFPNIFQIGDIYVSSENIDPATRFGGTWELIDKQFKSFYTSEDDTWFTPTSGTNTRSSNSYTRDGHSARIRIVTKTSKSLTDTDAELGTIDLEKLGMRSILGTLNVICYINDDALGIVAITFNTGALTWRGLVGEATNVASDASITIDAILETSSAYMLDDACDKFYWKRTR